MSLSLALIILKLFEKLFLKVLKLVIDRGEPVPKNQYGFRNKHFTIYQVHLMADVIEKALKGKQIFLEKGLVVHKFNKLLPPSM